MFEFLKRAHKGQIASLGNLALGLVVVAIVIAFGAYILSSVQTQINNSGVNQNQLAYTVGTTGLTSLATVVNFLPIVAIVAVAGVVLFFITRGGGLGGARV